MIATQILDTADRALRRVNKRGLKAYYNYTKKHSALKGKTPSESALIEIDGKNKWKTIIQNASLYKQTHT